MTSFQHRYPTKCPNCSNDLTAAASVELCFQVAGQSGEIASQLDASGCLQDVDHVVSHGHHSGTRCHKCQSWLDEYDIPNDPAAEKPRNPVMSKLLAACQAVAANWEQGDLAAAARLFSEAVQLATETGPPTAADSLERQQRLEQLLEKADAAGLEDEDLDETVHELAASIASDVNNSGLDGQLGFLLDEMGHEATLKQLNELAKDHS
jgi:hypothetical protein